MVVEKGTSYFRQPIVRASDWRLLGHEYFGTATQGGETKNIAALFEQDGDLEKFVDRTTDLIDMSSRVETGDLATVNLHSQMLAETKWIEALGSSLSKTGVLPEITEEWWLKRDENIELVHQGMKAMQPHLRGVGWGVDDYSTRFDGGAQGLKRLSRSMDLSMVKIVTREPGSEATLKSVVETETHKELIVLEQIETDQQLAWWLTLMGKLGVDLNRVAVQGNITGAKMKLTPE